MPLIKVDIRIFFSKLIKQVFSLLYFILNLFWRNLKIFDTIKVCINLLQKSSINLKINQLFCNYFIYILKKILFLKTIWFQKSQYWFDCIN